MPQQRQSPSHVAIVGCGFTGTTALHQLVHRYPVTRITIFEASGDFGPGFPYRVDESREYLINNTNDTMCLEPSNRRAFVEWLQQQPRYSADLDHKGHMPRAVYGEFLRDVVLQSVTTAAARGISVEFVAEEVVDLDEAVDGSVTVCHESATTSADMVLLATGRCPDRDVFDTDPAPAGLYIPTHMPGTRLGAIPNDAKCYILGASLSAYDVVNQLFSLDTGCEFVSDGANRLRYVAHRNQRRVVLCSRSGRLKKVQSLYPLQIDPGNMSLTAIRQFEPGKTTLANVLKVMVADATALGVEVNLDEIADSYRGCATQEAFNLRAAELLGRDIDAAAAPEGSTANFIVDYLNAAQFAIWDLFAAHALSPEDEATYRSQYERAMLTYSAPCPSPVAQKVLALMRAGNLRIIHGVRSVQENAADGSYQIAHAFGTDQARYLINATGAVDRNVSSDEQSTLVANLTRKGMLRAYRRNHGSPEGADVDMETFRVAENSNIHVANMFLWGPGIHVSSAVMMASIVDRILKTVFSGH